MSELVITGWPAIILAFVGAVAVTWYSLPKVIAIVSSNHITDHPGKHKIHKREVPTLGGISIFAGFITGFLLGVDSYMHSVSYLTAAAMLLFFIGVKDDMMNMDAWKKLVAEVLAALIIVLFTDLHFTSFHGFLGINEISPWISIPLTTFLIVLIINAVNLIDGIDGLASSIGIIASLFFGGWFILSGDYGYTVMAAALLGSLIVFLFFNVSNGAKKIFMGDTGSIVIGLILAIMAIRFNEINTTDQTVWKIKSAPAVSIAVLIVPLYDTLRVIILRLKAHQHLFAADNRHVHHMLIRLGLSHKKATLYISLFNVAMIVLALLLDGVGILWLGLILLAVCVITTTVLSRAIKKRAMPVKTPEVKAVEPVEISN